MSENLKLGQIITEPQQRDAIHIAVVPVVAAAMLMPGQPVTIGRDGKAYPVNATIVVGSMPSEKELADAAPEVVGVVDPFLKIPALQVSQTFWLFLNPGSITSLRHEWTHPAFPIEEPVKHDKAASEAWLRNFCAHADCPGYDAVMAAAQGLFEQKDDYYEGGGYTDGERMHFRGSDAHGDIPDEFWVHYEIVTGKKPVARPDHFSCSC